jgi:hypothetical protein
MITLTEADKITVRIMDDSGQVPVKVLADYIRAKRGEDGVQGNFLFPEDKPLLEGNWRFYSVGINTRSGINQATIVVNCWRYERHPPENLVEDEVDITDELNQGTPLPETNILFYSTPDGKAGIRVKFSNAVSEIEQPLPQLVKLLTEAYPALAKALFYSRQGLEAIALRKTSRKMSETNLRVWTEGMTQIGYGPIEKKIKGKGPLL